MASVNELELVKLLPSPFPLSCLFTRVRPFFCLLLFSILSNFKVVAVAWQSVTIFGCLHPDLGRHVSASLCFSGPFISRSIFCFYFFLLHVLYFAFIFDVITTPDVSVVNARGVYFPAELLTLFSSWMT